MHKYMLSLLAGTFESEMHKPGFWDNTLPELAAEALIDSGTDGQIDELILDEAQDLISPAYLDFFDLVLKGGLAAGHWRFFGDFERQNIYHGNVNPFDILAARCGLVPRFSLRANCRNAPRIASLAHLLGGLKPDYSKVLRPDDGFEATIWYYKSLEEQQCLLVKALEAFRKEGLSTNQVVVLSTKADVGASATSIMSGPWKDKLRPFGNCKQGNIPFCTVHAFKGLEAPGIIVTDLEHVAEPAAQDLFYVAVTRPLKRLTLLVANHAKEELLHVLLRSGSHAHKDY
jgi:superfamily I DNA/RNA helicase